MLTSRCSHSNSSNNFYSLNFCSLGVVFCPKHSLKEVITFLDMMFFMHLAGLELLVSQKQAVFVLHQNFWQCIKARPVLKYAPYRSSRSFDTAYLVHRDRCSG